MSVSSVVAVPIYVPTSLSPGDLYRLAFITSTERDALSTDIADYNTFVDGVAGAPPEIGDLDWRAIASTASVDARNNTMSNPGVDGAGVPIFLLDDTMLALDNNDLWDGDILTTLEITEFGTPLGSVTAWTGTNSDGQASFAPLGDGIVSTGTSDSTLTEWVEFIVVDPVDPSHFYALSPIITVSGGAAVPEPSTFFLAAIGLALTVGFRGRRRRPSATGSS